jgi:hypothetical protein
LTAKPSNECNICNAIKQTQGKFMKYLYAAFAVIFAVSIYMLFNIAHAQETVLAPADFLSQILSAVKSFGGLSWMLKVSAVLTIVISSMKVSFFRGLVWDKLGALKPWLAPILGLLAGILTLGAGGGMSLAGVMAWISAGAGAIIFHELLDTVKAIPGLGPMWVSVIDIISGLLGGAPKV